MRKILIVGMLLGLLWLASLEASGSIRGGQEGQTHSAALRASSKRERDRVLSLMEKGVAYDAWRFATVALTDGDLEVRNNGVIVLLRLVGHQAAYYVPVRALLEQVLVKARKLDYQERASLIWFYGDLADTGGTAMDTTAFQECAQLAKVAHRDGSLSAKGVSRCNELMSTSDPSKWRASITILLVAANLRPRDRQWSVECCHRLLSKVTGDKTTMWAVLYETVTGKFLDKFR